VTSYHSYAPWCGHCKALAPVWDELSVSLKGRVSVGKVDCTVEKTICERFKVRGYPSLRFVKDSQQFPYRGRERTVAALSAFALADYATQSAPTPFTTAADYAFELASPPAQAPVPPAQATSAGAAAPATATADAAKAAAQRDGVKVQNSLLWDAPGAPGPAGRWDGASGPSDLVRTLSDGNFDQKTASGVWLLQLCAPNVRACEVYRATTDRLATTVKGESVSVAAVDCLLERALCDRLQVAAFPTILLVKDGKMHAYAGDRSHDKLAQFSYADYRGVAGVPVPPRGTEAPAHAKDAYIAALPTPMTEQAAAGASAAPATTLAATARTTLNGVEMEGDVVLLTDANAPTLLQSGVWFVEVYAPWCGHCKKFEPTWAEFASKLKAAGSAVRIAKTDGTIHTVLADKLKVAGFPTLRFIKEGAMYEWRGATRSLELLESYVQTRYAQTPQHPAPYGYNPNAPSTGAPLPPASVSQTTERAPPVRRSELWDADDAPGAKGRWDGSPTTSALVRDITAANWNERSKKGGLLQLCELAEKQCAFYRPTLERVASTLLSHGVDVIAIDCSVERVLCIKLGTGNLPDVRMLAGGQMYAYNDVRNHDKLVAFATSSYRAGKAIAIPQLDKAALAEDAAQPTAPLPPAVVTPTSAAVASDAAATAASASAAGAAAAASAAKPAAAQQTTQTWPGVTQLTMTNFALTTAYGDWLVAFVRAGEAESEAFSALVSVFAAKKTLGTVSLSVIDCSTESVLCGAFRVSKTPRVAIFSSNKYYKHDGPLTTAAITEFAEWRWRSMQSANLGEAPSEFAIWARPDVLAAVALAMVLGFIIARCANSPPAPKPAAPKPAAGAAAAVAQPTPAAPSGKHGGKQQQQQQHQHK
jgi:protein disulfide-isomerase A1